MTHAISHYSMYFFAGKGPGGDSPNPGSAGGGGGGHGGRGGRSAITSFTGDSYGSFTEPMDFGML